MQNRLPFLTATLLKHCTWAHSCKATKNASNGLVQACFFPLFIFLFGSLFAKNTRVLFTFSLQSLLNRQSHFSLIYSHNRILWSVKKYKKQIFRCCFLYATAISFSCMVCVLLYRLCSVDMKKKRFIHEEVYACARPSGDLTIGITCPHSKTLRSTSIAVVKYKLAIFLSHWIGGVYLIICALCLRE